MKKNYPEHEIISDIRSGLNFKRKGLQELIKIAIDGHLSEVVVAHKDRLCRFGFDLFDFLIKSYSNGEIKIHEEKKESVNEELVNYLVQIINVFSARLNGHRKYNL